MDIINWLSSYKTLWHKNFYVYCGLIKFYLYTCHFKSNSSCALAKFWYLHMINPAKHKKIEPFIYSFILKLLTISDQTTLDSVHCALWLASCWNHKAKMWAVQYHPQNLAGKQSCGAAVLSVVVWVCLKHQIAKWWND